MFKKIRPLEDRAMDIEQFPHCDPRVLHAPAECEYCDKYPAWQAIRRYWGIAFTGYEPEGTELPCPADYARGDNHKKWGGNQARPISGAGIIHGHNHLGGTNVSGCPACEIISPDSDATGHK